MPAEKARAEITVSGLVQGVGFRYFVMTNAERIGVNGYVMNLTNGDVLAVAEGKKELVEALANKMKSGPSHSHVTDFRISWDEPKNEFTRFEVRY